MTDLGYPICLTCGKLWQADMNKNQDEVIDRLQKELAFAKKNADRYLVMLSAAFALKDSCGNKSSVTMNGKEDMLDEALAKRSKL